MATIYIDPSVSGTGTGSFADPYQSWGSVTWTAGNIYLQKEGTVFTSTITVGNSGTSANTITIGTYDAISGNQVTDSSKYAIVKTTSGSGIVALSRTYINLSNYIIYPASSGVILTGSSFCNITRCIVVGGVNGVYGERTNNINATFLTLSNGSGSGVALLTNTSTDVYNWKITDSTISGYANHGVYVFCSSDASTTGNAYNIKIQRNIIKQNTQYGIRIFGRVFTTANAQAYGILIESNKIYKNGGAGLNLLDVRGTISNSIRRNKIYDNCASFSTEGGIWCGRVDNLTVEYNEVYNNHSNNNIDGIGILIDFDTASVGCDNVVVRGNLVYSHDDSQLTTVSKGTGILIIYATNTYVYGNICIGNYRGIGAGHDTTTGPVYIFNNTCINNIDAQLFVYDAITSAEFYNNLCLGGRYGFYNDGTATSTANYNNYYGASLGNYSGQAAGAQDTTLSTIVSSGFTPSNSTLWESGTFKGGADFYGKRYSQTPSIGAVQYIPTKTISMIRGIVG